MLIETDDFFAHQIAEPHAHVLLNDPSWAERAYFPVSDPDRFALDSGMALYPNNDAIEAYAIATTPAGQQLSMRSSRDLSEGRWPLRAGPVKMDVIEPLRRWHLVCEENDSGISFDLEYTARAAPHESRSPRIYQRNRLMYDNVNVLQAGRYRGEVRIDGEAYEVDGIPGHRDRTWGIRASGEGRVPRGLFVWLSAEFDDLAVMAIIHDRHDGTPLRRMGAISHESSQELIELTGFDHDLIFDHDSRQLTGGTFFLDDAAGNRWKVDVEPVMRLYLRGAGYTLRGPRRGELGARFWTERWDLTDPVVVRRVDELNDNICWVRCGARHGHGVVETLLGEHDRYRVAPTVDAIPSPG